MFRNKYEVLIDAYMQSVKFKENESISIFGKTKINVAKEYKFH